MKKKSVNFLKPLMVLFFVFTLLCGCTRAGSENGVSTKPYNEMNFDGEQLPDGAVCENDRFILFWNAAFQQVVIRDKQSGAEYSTMPIEAMEPKYDEDGFEIINSPQVESPIYVYYYNPDTLLERELLGSNDAIYDGEIHTVQIENGICVTYEFSSVEISVPVNYIIYEDRFEISVDPAEISDNGDYIATGVSLAPFLCSLPNNAEDSYFFLPDGSGTLIEPKTFDLVGKQGSLQVYGADMTVSQYTVDSYTKQCNLPVFGVKNGNSGLFGIITSGVEQAELSWDIGGENKRYSSVYPFFRIRSYDLIKRPDNFWGNGAYIQRFDENISAELLTVAYFPLSGDKADYNGMAEIYRNYLLENEMLSKSGSEEPVTVLKILGGAEQKAFTLGIPHTVLETVTTLTQAQEMIEYFRSAVKGKLLVDLVGFGESGFDIGEIGGGFKIASEFGNESGINDLIGYCSGNGVEIFLDFDLINFNKSSSGFSVGDSVKLLDGQTLYMYGFNNVTRERTDEHYMLLSRGRLADAAEKAESTAACYGFDGVSLTTLSNKIYGDYSVSNARGAANMGRQVSELFEESLNGTKVMSVSANAYAAAASDYIIDAPLSSSKLDVSSTDVPFYQMVFRGFIPMSGESLNITEDSDISFLKCVEAGIAPTYTLSYNGSENSITTDYYALPLSSYEGNREQIIEKAEKISELLPLISGSGIESHDILENGLRVTEFDNGIKAVVNYGEIPLEYNGITVESESYTVSEG